MNYNISEILLWKEPHIPDLLIHYKNLSNVHRIKLKYVFVMVELSMIYLHFGDFRYFQF